jgi:two-component system NtrC family sensor kinase
MSRRVLIVDDSPAIHDAFVKVLGKTFEVSSAFQGREALELVVAAREASQPFALAFVDMRMPPGWDGMETIEQLWRVDPELQIVICSAHHDYSWSEIRERFGNRDGLLIIAKPIETLEIAQAAHAMTAKWNLAREVRMHVDELERRVAARTEELEVATRALRLAQKLEAIGQITTGVAHELNTPIQYLGDSIGFVRDGSLELLAFAKQVREVAARESPAHTQLRALLGGLDLAFLEEEFPKAVDSVHHGVDRVASIVRAMKELSHPGSRNAIVTDINRALDNALCVTASTYKYFADVESDYGEIPPVVCFAGDLYQVFLNLIVNAAHAMEDRRVPNGPRGKLRVTTRVVEPHVVISISDTGAGIPDSVRDRVFDAFFTTKEVGRGTGQGLAIAKTIVVDRHGGTLTFDSAPGLGTTFHIAIPLAGPQQRAA